MQIDSFKNHKYRIQASHSLYLTEACNKYIVFLNVKTVMSQITCRQLDQNPTVTTLFLFCLSNINAKFGRIWGLRAGKEW